MAKGVDTNGDERVKVPSMKPNLFFVSKAFLTNQAQVGNSHSLLMAESQE